MIVLFGKNEIGDSDMLSGEGDCFCVYEIFNIGIKGTDKRREDVLTAILSKEFKHIQNI